jgi:hypothetical protein
MAFIKRLLDDRQSLKLVSDSSFDFRHITQFIRLKLISDPPSRFILANHHLLSSRHD